MTLPSWVYVNTGWVADVVEDGEDAGHNVRDPASYEKCIECSARHFMMKAKCVRDFDDWALFLKENNCPNR